MSIDRNLRLHQPPIFVGGVQRAGTTLLVKMLNKSTSISFLPQETHLYPLLWMPLGKMKSFSSNAELAAFLEKKLPEVNYGWTEAPEFLNQICTTISQSQQKFASTEDLLEVVLKIWEQQNGENITTGEKTPAHIYYAQSTLNHFPNSKMILMCRDPRAVALSEMVKLKNNPRTNRDFNTFNFVVRYGTALALIQQLKKRKNVLFVRYEDLIQQPKATLQSVTDFLNIEFKESMLEVGVTNSSFQDKKQAGIQFNTENLNRWEADLPNEITQMIELHLAKEMVNLHYPLSGLPELPISAAKKIKQKLKFELALLATYTQPAVFHHFNRNKKYK
jgi:hypothetical protein